MMLHFQRPWTVPLRQEKENGAIFHSLTKELNTRNVQQRTSINHGVLPMTYIKIDGVFVKVTIYSFTVTFKVSRRTWVWGNKLTLM